MTLRALLPIRRSGDEIKKLRRRAPASDGMIDRNHLRRYRDAMIYQLHVKSVFDANNDGIGDVGGLTEKFDYIVDLGARLQD